MNAYRGRGGTSSRVRSCVEMNCQLHALAVLLPVRSIRYSLDRRVDGTQSLPSRGAYFCGESNPVASRFTDWAVPPRSHFVPLKWGHFKAYVTVHRDAWNSKRSWADVVLTALPSHSNDNHEEVISLKKTALNEMERFCCSLLVNEFAVLKGTRNYNWKYTLITGLF